MAGTTKNLTPSEILQSPGDLWMIPTPPADSTAPQLTLASDLSPDSTAHPSSVHQGAIMSAITGTFKPKILEVLTDQDDAPLGSFLGEMSASIEAELAQTSATLAQTALGVGTYATGSGYQQVTWGGNLVVPVFCIAAIAPKRTNALQAVVQMLFNACATTGFEISMGRAKPNSYKVTYTGLSDLTRVAGRQIGIVYATMTNAAGGTPTARNIVPAQIMQGPADFWLISPAPTDTAQRVTLAADLTPDAATHGSSYHLGSTTGAVKLTVKPKIGFGRVDQADGNVYAFVESIQSTLEAEMAQTECQKLAYALGLGTLDNFLSAAGYAEVTVGGSNQPNSVCVAAIAPKRTAPTLAAVSCLYSAVGTDGFTVSFSRKKANSYKVSFSGYKDPTRTAGRQIGIYHEQI